MDSDGFEYASLSNLSFIEKLYHSYLANPQSVDLSWRYFFEGMHIASSLQGLAPSTSHAVAVQGKWDLRAKNLIAGYRSFGHLAAHCNPLEEEKCSQEIKELMFETYGFTVEDLEKEVSSCGLLSQEQVPLAALIAILKKIYCSKVGIEVAQLEPAQQEWVIKKVEQELNTPFGHEEQLAILEDLNRSEIFESFIHTKYPGQKRFSLEGGESLIPMLSKVLEKSVQLGVTTAVIGMAHRGRLNVLANILQKSYAQIFYEFSPDYMPNTCEGSGDVKYHKGFAASVMTRQGHTLEVHLCENPSHLESVDPVLQGMCKAKQMKQGNKAILPILIHGDASLTGQGVVYETLQMSGLEGYSTGGTLHIVVNNQVGFTATSREGRSTRYCTDIAKGFGCPVFHVNGDDPEGCVRIATLAAEFRHYFHCDVFVEILCYRKYGHSEGDEPLFTQPKLYQSIQQKQSVRRLYRDALIAEKKLSAAEVEQLEKVFSDTLHQAEAEVHQITHTPHERARESVKRVAEVHTQVEEGVLMELAEKFCALPPEFKVHPKVQRLFTERLHAMQQKKGIDWGLAEYLAYASLLIKGYPVRISGQDCERGTFSHRHAVIVDQLSEKKYFPLQHLAPHQGTFTIYNSFLSEYAVMGFEFGYAQEMKGGLTIWEAQFGDFANGAQIIIDQYIAASEQKWGVHNPLVLFLPHGYEGQGPEHTSGRIERFLQLAAQGNMSVIVPSKPSQLFHALRRQVLSQICKPLIVFTPKALLRYAPTLSELSEFSKQSFQEVIEDPEHIKATRLMMCTGKIYYDLIEQRETKKAHHVAIIRLEQLYPLNKKALIELLSRYSSAKSYFWIQEEHKNMGAYEYIYSELRELLPDNVKLCYVGRARSASPAAGSLALHQREKDELLRRAFGEGGNPE